MRSLALARYRFQTLIRASTGMFPALLIASALPLLIVHLASTYATSIDWTEFMEIAGASVWMAYVLHCLAIVMLVASFGFVREKAGEVPRGDLLDSAPFSGAARFWGDALGIFLAALTLHVCILPVLAHGAAMSLIAARTFCFLEIAIAFGLLFLSTTASWSLRAQSSRRSQARAGLSQFLYVILAILLMRMSVNRSAMRDAWASFFEYGSSSRAWAVFLNGIDRPVLLIAGIAVLYAGFVTFYFLHSVRTLEEA